MYIRQLDIYGFGKHEQVTINLSNDLSLLFGKNEAGKTTIQQFILHILFGFPQKNSTYLRYEPKNGTAYGGCLHIVDETYGEITIKRVRGKSAGDVTVYFSDGTIGHEEALQKILRFYDRTAYEAVFSFSLLQLQDFEKMDEQQLSRALLASGTTGIDALFELEGKLRKEHDRSFKRSGKVPEINVKIEQVHLLEQEMNRVRQQLDMYFPKITQIGLLEKELEEAKRLEEQLRNEWQQLQLHQQLLPVVQSVEMLEMKLAQVTDQVFPADGIRRYEQLKIQLVELHASVQQKKEELLKRNTPISTMPEQQISEMEQMLVNETEWHEWLGTYEHFQHDVQQLQKQLHMLQERLGTQHDANHLQNVDVSLEREEELYELVEQRDKLQQQLNAKKDELAQVGAEWQKKEQEWQVVLTNGPTAEERTMAAEWPAIRQRLAESKAYKMLQSPQTFTMKYAGILLGIIVLVLLYAVTQQQWLITGLFAIVGASVVILLNKITKQDEPSPKEKEMTRLIETYDGREQEMELLVQRLFQFQQHEELFTQQLDAFSGHHNHLVEQVDRLKEKVVQVTSKLQQFLASYGIVTIPKSSLIPELFRLFRDIQETTYSITIKQQQVLRLQEQIANRHRQIERLLNKALPEKGLYDFLRQAYIEQRELLQQKQENQQSVEQLQQEMAENTEHYQLLEKSVQQLLEEAGANTETQYYEAYERFEEAERLRQQLVDKKAQLAVHANQNWMKEQPLKLALLAHDEKSLRLQEKIHTLREKKSALQVEADQLANSDELDLLQQQYEIEKAELANLATAWSKRQLLLSSIEATMQDLQQSKLPAVLQAANQLFKQLTNGRYVELFIAPTGYFHVLSKERVSYPIVELSQATKEQAFIALRFSLASSFRDKMNFPIIMDDPFVHFDEQRMEQMKQILQTFARHQQMIFFTCHERLLYDWKEATIIDVASLEKSEEVI